MLTGVQEVDQATAKSLYRFSIRAGTNILMLGNAGVGKTEMATQASEEEDFEYIYLNLSVLEAPDLMGLPMIDHETRTTDYATPKNLPALGTGKKKVLIVDELDKGKPELQNPMLEMFQFRSINGRKMDIHSVIATGNLPDEGAFSLPISHALTNRCSVYKMSTSFEPWQMWAAQSRVNGLVVGFLSKNPEFLLMKPPEGDDTAYANASPRAWTYAARDLDLAEAAKDLDVNYQTLLVAGRVGQAAATKFRVWLEHYRHIEPVINALVRDGKHPNVDGMTVDRIMVCAIAGCNAIVRAYSEVKADQKISDAEFKAKQKAKLFGITKNVFSWLKHVPPDFAIGAVKSTLDMKQISAWQLTQVPELMEVYVKIRHSMNS